MEDGKKVSPSFFQITNKPHSFYELKCPSLISLIVLWTYVPVPNKPHSFYGLKFPSLISLIVSMGFL